MYLENKDRTPKKISPRELAHTFRRWHVSGIISEATMRSLVEFTVTLETVAKIRDHMDRFGRKFEHKPLKHK